MYTSVAVKYNRQNRKKKEKNVYLQNHPLLRTFSIGLPDLKPAQNAGRLREEFVNSKPEVFSQYYAGKPIASSLTRLLYTVYRCIKR